jgi:hypothetical protein
MKKNDMLPILAAFVIALLIFPMLALPVNAVTPATGGNIGSVVTIPEDDLKRNTGVMVLGLSSGVSLLYGQDDAGNQVWFTDSLCTKAITQDTGKLYETVGPEVTSEWVANDGAVMFRYEKTGTSANANCVMHEYLKLWGTGGMNYPYGPGTDLLSQHKILATLNGVPTKPDYFLCEVIEKEKAKIPPMNSKDPSKRQFDDELIKTTVKDVSSNFICKVHWVKPGVGALDVYFVGPRVKNFIADHMLIVTMGWKVGRTTVWASDLQDICILGWSMDPIYLQIKLFYNPGKSTWPGGNEYYFSWIDALGHYVSCDEAAAWQRTWIYGGWPYSTN